MMEQKDPKKQATLLFIFCFFVEVLAPLPYKNLTRAVSNLAHLEYRLELTA
jgi:hypothetical protein